MKTLTDKDSYKKGTFFLICSSMSFALLNFFIRMAGDLPSMQKIFFRNIVALVVAYLILMKKGQAKEIIPTIRTNWKLLNVRALCGIVGMFGNFYAVDHLLLADASLLAKMSPFFAVIFSFLFLREKETPGQVLCLIGAFGGSLLIIKPTFSNMLLVPAIVGFVGGMGAGAAYTAIRAMGGKKVNGSVIVFYFSLFTTVVSLVYLAFTGVEPMSVSQWVYLGLAGLCGCSGQFCVTAAYRYAPAREISVYDYSQVIFSAILGYFFFTQLPDLLSVAGYVVVIAMAVIMFFLSKRHARA